VTVCSTLRAKGAERIGGRAIGGIGANGKVRFPRLELTHLKP
jgi:hypothetical protein